MAAAAAVAMCTPILMTRLGIERRPSLRLRVGMGLAVGAVSWWVLARPLPLYPRWEMAALMMVWGLVVWADWAERIIPNRLVLATLALGAAARILSSGAGWLAAGETGLGIFLFFMAINLLSRGGLGMGDAKFGGAMGFALSWPVGLFAVCIGIWVAAVWALGLILTRRRHRRRSIAFGPFLVFGGIVGLAGLWH